MEGTSDYLVFVDESGDHGLENIDPNYPIFVLAFCIVHKDTYMRSLAPAMQAFKLKHFGHDAVVLHERDIRKDAGAFAFLRTPAAKAAFLDELTHIVQATPFTLVCSAIRKEALKTRYPSPDNPYNIALGFGLESVYAYLRARTADAATTHVLVECRGKREDSDLELAFRRICAGENYKKERMPLQIVFVDKRANSPGLQLADLVARPVGLHLLRPAQPNRAFAALADKFFVSAGGKRAGWGLKCFP